MRLCGYEAIRIIICSSGQSYNCNECNFCLLIENIVLNARAIPSQSCLVNSTNGNAFVGRNLYKFVKENLHYIYKFLT